MLSLRAAVVANQSITASMLGVSDRWICRIIRHSREAFLLHWSSACSLTCNVNVVNKTVALAYNIIFFLRGDWGWLWLPWPPPGYAPDLHVPRSTANTKSQDGPRVACWLVDKCGIMSICTPLTRPNTTPCRTYSSISTGHSITTESYKSSTTFQHHTCHQWRRSVVIYGGGSRSVRSSHQIVSGASKKIVLPSIFDANLHDVKLAELSKNSFEWKNVTF